MAISRTWNMQFNAVPFEELEASIIESLDEFGQFFLASLPPRVKPLLKDHIDTCLNTARDLLPQYVHEAKSAMIQQRKQVSRSLDSHVGHHLEDTYDLALVEKGKGSVRRQKVCPFTLSRPSLSWQH
jgi:hypothetical protein